jgi:hypothetical protein
MDHSTPPPPPQSPRPERRAPARLLYTVDQVLGRTPIWLRRRADKLRLAGHLAVVVALAVLSVWWVLGDHALTGRVLVALAPGRGVHLGDLAILAFIVPARRSLRSARRLQRRS